MMIECYDFDKRANTFEPYSECPDVGKRGGRIREWVGEKKKKNKKKNMKENKKQERKIKAGKRKRWRQRISIKAIISKDQQL